MARKKKGKRRRAARKGKIKVPRPIPPKKRR